MFLLLLRRSLFRFRLHVPIIRFAQSTGAEKKHSHFNDDAIQFHDCVWMLLRSRSLHFLCRRQLGVVVNVIASIRCIIGCHLRESHNFFSIDLWQCQRNKSTHWGTKNECVKWQFWRHTNDNSISNRMRRGWNEKWRKANEPNEATSI